MKKVLFSIAALAVALGFTACSNEDEALSVKGGKITVLAMTETGTRTALESDGEGAYNVVWSEGDYIYDFAGNKIYNISSGAGSTTAKFTGPAVKPNQYIAYLYGTGNDYPTWPTYQTYKANTVDVFPMRAVGISDADGNLSPLQFKNFGGVLRLNVKGTATIKKIVVSANEYMSGELSMSWQSTAIDPIAAQISTYTGKNSIELNCGTGVALDATNGTDFYIAVPENTYTGVEIALTDTEGKICTKKFKGTNGLVIERSKITKASFSTYKVGDKLTIDGHEGIVVNINGKLVIVATKNVGATAVNGAGCLGYRLAFAETYTDWEGWRLPSVDEIKTLCDVKYPTWGDLGEGVGTGALLWDFDSDGGIDLYLPLNDYDDTNPYDKYWTETQGENDKKKCFYFAPELDWDSGSYHDYTPVDYVWRGKNGVLPYKEEAAKDSEFLVRLFHDLP